MSFAAERYLSRGPDGRTLVCTNYKEVFELAYLHPNKKTLLTFLGITSDTFKRLCERDPKFKRAIELGYAKRRKWLLERLYNKVDDTRVLLHLAKNMLGHIDKVEVSKGVENLTDDDDPTVTTLADACREAAEGLEKLRGTKS